jgi:hypothetical protein
MPATHGPMSKARNTHKNATTTIVLLLPAWRARVERLNEPFRQKDIEPETDSVLRYKLKSIPAYHDKGGLS